MRSCNREMGEELGRVERPGLFTFDVRAFDDPHAGQLRQHDGRRRGLIATVVI